jgi:hypothetical protein
MRASVERDEGGNMRLIDSAGEKRLHQVQLYLSLAEARELVAELSKLVADPERKDHFHVFSEDGGAELSCSIVTPRKLEGDGYTKGEREAFGRWKPRG